MNDLERPDPMRSWLFICALELPIGRRASAFCAELEAWPVTYRPRAQA